MAALLSSSSARPVTSATLLRPAFLRLGSRSPPSDPPLQPHPPTFPLPSVPGQQQQRAAEELAMSLAFTLGHLLNLGNTEAASRTGEAPHTGSGSQSNPPQAQTYARLIQAAAAGAAGPQHSMRLSQADVDGRRVRSSLSPRAGFYGQAGQSQHLGPAAGAMSDASPQRSRPLTQAEIDERMASRRVQPSPRRGRAVTPQHQRRGSPQQAQPENTGAERMASQRVQPSPHRGRAVTPQPQRSPQQAQPEDTGADQPQQEVVPQPEQPRLRSFAAVLANRAVISGPVTVLQPAVASAPANVTAPWLRPASGQSTSQGPEPAQAPQ